MGVDGLRVSKGFEGRRMVEACRGAVGVGARICVQGDTRRRRAAWWR